MPRTAPGKLAGMMQNMTLAQEAASKLATIETHLRIQTALQQRAGDQDEALHTQWKRAAVKAPAGAGLAIVQFDVQDDNAMWELTRVSIVRSGGGAATAKAAYVSLDTVNPEGIVETILPASVAALVAPDGRLIFAYADAFNNKIMVGSGRRIYVVSTTEGTEDVVVNLQVRNLINYAEATIEAGYDADMTFLAPAEGRDANDPQTGVTGRVFSHVTPDVFAETPDAQPDAGPEHTELQDDQPGAAGTQHRELLPDFAAKLPAHLRDGLATMGDQDDAGQGDGS